MRHPLFITIALLILGMGLVNGFNNTFPRLFLLTLFIVYICIPVYLKIRSLISKHVPTRRHYPKAWA